MLIFVFFVCESAKGFMSSRLLIYLAPFPPPSKKCASERYQNKTGKKTSPPFSSLPSPPPIFQSILSPPSPPSPRFPRKKSQYAHRQQREKSKSVGDIFFSVETRASERSVWEIRITLRAAASKKLARNTCPPPPLALPIHTSTRHVAW